MLSLLSIAYIVSITALFITCVALLSIRTAPSLKDRRYKVAKVFLALATFIVALGNAVIFCTGVENNIVDLLSLPVLIVSCLQACLFTFLVLIMFGSSFVKWRNIIKYLLSTIIITFIYFVVILFVPDVEVYNFTEYVQHIGNPALLLRSLLAISYVVQIACYVRLLRRERRIYLEKINNYFSDVEQLQLRLGTRMFYEAASLGILVFFFSIFPTNRFDFILSIIITLFYLSFTIRYQNYQYTLIAISPAVIEQPDEEEEEVQEEIKEEIQEDENICKKQVQTIIRENRNDLSEIEKKSYSSAKQVGERLNELLLSGPFYTDKNIVITDLARMLCCTKRSLSNYINTTYNQNFNSWINTLRVDYAKEIMDAPELSDMKLNQISDRAGFANASMFSREFKKKFGITPMNYRKTKG